MTPWTGFLFLGLALLHPGQSATPDERLVTPWVVPGDRRPPTIMNIPYTNQDGTAGVLGGLMNKPAIVAFFYTRCQNAAKCSMTVSRLAALQRMLREQGLDSNARVLAITYEPQFDTADRLHRFASDRGLVFGPDTQALRIEAAPLKALLDVIEAPVNYNAGWVNTHGVELSLFDAGGRLVRRYASIAWDNSAVVADLKRVMSGQ
jgi:protein SCO1/2